MQRSLLRQSAVLARLCRVVPKRFETTDKDIDVRNYTVLKNLFLFIEFFFQHTRLVINKSPKPVVRPKNEELVFGRTLTNDILYVEWDQASGWGAPEIKPYGPLGLEPASLCLHYGLEVSFQFHDFFMIFLLIFLKCFEGMKAYKDANNKLRLFRPMENMKRLNSSATRISLPVCSFLFLGE
jgi:hypothetical protein